MSSDNLYDTLKQTALGHIKAFEDPRPWDPDDVWSYRTEDCVHTLHPSDPVAAPSNVGFRKDEMYQILRFFGSIMDSTRFDIQDVVVDEQQRTVVTKVTATLDLKAVGDEAAVKGWQSEFMWLVEMEDSGKKIKRVEEFMDVGRLTSEVKARAERHAALRQ